MWVSDKGMNHTRGEPCHPQTQGKIERWHQTLKNRIPGKLIPVGVILNGRSQRSSITTTTAATMRSSAASHPLTSTSGAATSSCWKGKRIKRETIKQRRLLHREVAA